MNSSSYPKISVVTPVYNQVDFIESTIRSVLDQKYPNVEYIIIDGASTDGTIEIIQTYKDQIHKIISEPDNGMYDALNKGLQLATGDIMCWINSDDILLPNAFDQMAKLFQDLQHVNWVKGLNSFIDLNDKISGMGSISLVHCSLLFVIVPNLDLIYLL